MAPKQKPGRSKQNYGTPDVFIAAVKARLGIEDFDIDLAADSHNAKAPRFYTEADDAFTMPWNYNGGWNWLNPPFGRIGPWVQRAYEEINNGVNTAVLVPAGVGANWWRDWVHGKANVLFLNGRLTFVGTPINPKTGKQDPYPKDCALLLYSVAAIRGTYDIWAWDV